jgi:hypothetical protein
MAYEIRDNSGSLFINDKREKDTHPNLNGTVMVDGKEYWISAWTKERNNGEKWLSLAFKPKDAKVGGAYQAPRESLDADLDDEIPF